MKAKMIGKPAIVNGLRFEEYEKDSCADTYFRVYRFATNEHVATVYDPSLLKLLKESSCL